jgi:hypothetical protein
MRRIIILILILLASPVWAQTPVNIAPSATVTVSTERPDTGQLGIKAVDGIVDGCTPVNGCTPEHFTHEWATQNQLQGAWIKLTWMSPVSLTSVTLHDRPHPVENIQAGSLTFSDGSTVAVGMLPNDGTGLLVPFSPKTVTWVQFTVLQAVGVNIGLSEIEVVGAAVVVVPPPPLPPPPPPAVAPPTSEELLAVLKEWDAFQTKFDAAFLALENEWGVLATKMRDLIKRSQP